MKRYYLIVVISVLLSGCYEKGEDSYQFKWAIVDKRALIEEINLLAKKKNPYPEILVVDREKDYGKQSYLSSEIYRRKTDLIKKCMSSPNKPEIEKKKFFYPRSGRGLEEAYGMYIHGQSVMGRRIYYDQACKDQVDADPRILDLQRRKRKLDKVIIMRRQYDTRVGVVSHEYAQKLIDQYAKTRYEVIINKGMENVIYNKTGLEADITAELISKIDDSKLVLPKEHSSVDDL